MQYTESGQMTGHVEMNIKHKTPTNMLG